MTSGNPSRSDALKRAVSDCMDTGHFETLSAALEVFSAEEILIAAENFGGHEWLVILESLPPTRQKELRSLLDDRKLTALREAIMTSLSALEMTGNRQGHRFNLENYLDHSPALEMGEWHRWPEIVSHPQVNECVRFVYFTTEEGLLLARASLTDLAAAKATGLRAPRTESPVSALRTTASPLTAWRALRLGDWNELPVVDENRRLVGVLYRERLTRHLVINRLLPSSGSLRPGLVDRFKKWLARIRDHASSRHSSRDRFCGGL